MDPTEAAEGDTLAAGVADPAMVSETETLVPCTADPAVVSEGMPFAAGAADSVMVAEVETPVACAADPSVVTEVACVDDPADATEGVAPVAWGVETTGVTEVHVLSSDITALATLRVGGDVDFNGEALSACRADPIDVMEAAVPLSVCGVESEAEAERVHVSVAEGVVDFTELVHVIEAGVALELLSFTLEFEAGASAKDATGNDAGETEIEMSSKETGIVFESVTELGDETVADESEAGLFKTRFSWRALISASLADVKCDELTGALDVS